MLDEQERKEVIKQFKLLQILWICMLASLGLCILLSHMASQAMIQNIHYTQSIPDINSSMPGLMSAENMTYLIAAGMLLFAYFIRQLALKGRIRMNQSPRFRNIKPAFFANYYAATIIPLSIMEIVGMSGAVLFLAGHAFYHVYILAAVGTAGIYLCRPRKEEIEALAGERIFDIQNGFSSRVRT